MSHAWLQQAAVILGGLILMTGSAAAQNVDSATAVDESEETSNLQDSVTLYRLFGAALPPDGLLRVSIGGRNYGTTYETESERYQVDLRDYVLGLELGLRPGLHLRAEWPWRTWFGARAPVASSGSGPGDVVIETIVGLPPGGRRWGWALRAGTTLPSGDQQKGLSEGRTSAHLDLGLTAVFWRRSDLPQMRLHLNLGTRLNRNEADGYGFAAGERLQPWYPRYPAVSAGGTGSENDFLRWGAALEFRAPTAALFLEYSEARLSGSDLVGHREYQRFLTAGMTWGRAEGWALRTAYDVSLAREDYATDFTAAYPDLVFALSISRQFSIGGRDRDGDGIPDRSDRCPEVPEDRDGYQDHDGCPDLDNDRDGIPDALDLAPDQAEDLDGFLDEDGVPDLDNDEDGIVDRQDVCPDLAEDLDGYQDDDGCPEEFADNDGDGIADEDDRCPEVAEDLDGFEDADGCPDLDNDLDGIEDALDGCPEEPEDYNGFEDDDGCPEASAED